MQHCYRPVNETFFIWDENVLFEKGISEISYFIYLYQCQSHLVGLPDVKLKKW